MSDIHQLRGWTVDAGSGSVSIVNTGVFSDNHALYLSTSVTGEGGARQLFFVTIYITSEMQLIWSSAFGLKIKVRLDIPALHLM
ncbi:MAG: hypothetical protein U1D30_07435 [Planctomycetota bacterium]